MKMKGIQNVSIVPPHHQNQNASAQVFVQKLGELTTLEWVAWSVITFLCVLAMQSAKQFDNQHAWQGYMPLWHQMFYQSIDKGRIARVTALALLWFGTQNFILQVFFVLPVRTQFRPYTAPTPSHPATLLFLPLPHRSTVHILSLSSPLYTHV